MAIGIRSFSVDHDQMINIMKRSWSEWKYLIDPHTATAMHAACCEKRYVLHISQNFLQRMFTVHTQIDFGKKLWKNLVKRFVFVV
jgi:hypothetical protein